MFISVGEFPGLLMFRVSLGVSELMQVASNNGLRLIVLRYGHGLQTVAALPNICVASYEIDKVRPLQKQLRHPRIVIVFSRNMTISTSLRLPGPNGMGIMRIECLAVIAFGRTRLLLMIDPFTVRIL